MTREEIHGFRDEAYSRWHRAIPLELELLNIDWMERCSQCRQIVAIYELARDVGQSYKKAYGTQDLAYRSKIPGFVVLYRVRDERIVRFRVRQLWPTEDTDFEYLSVAEWQSRLVDFRRCHRVVQTQEYQPFLPPRIVIPQESAG